MFENLRAARGHVGVWVLGGHVGIRGHVGGMFECGN